MSIFDDLTAKADDVGLTANELIRAGIGRSTAYAFLRGEHKDYKERTLTVISDVLADKKLEKSSDT